MKTNSRRGFLLTSAALAAGVSMAGAARAQAAKLEESDPQAAALGYVNDSSKANQAKYPAHTPAQMCANCQLFQGKAGDASGPCPIYSGKIVAAKGWCSAYSKKA
jgi:hypothetical protein